MIRVALVTMQGTIKSENFELRSQADDYLLKIDEAEQLKCYKIIDIETKEIIENWRKQ